jgi:galactokinase
MSETLNSSILNSFKTRFGTEPILISAPGRINIIGEHTDYNEGFVFPAAIDKMIILGIQHCIGEECTIIADDLNESFDFCLNNVEQQEQGSWKNYVLGVIHEIQLMGYELTPFQLVFGGNIPAGSGLSSSAALENAVVYGINELLQLGLTKKQMIFISQKAEHNFVGVKCGIMDQYASMFGEENHLLLLDCRSIEAQQFKVELKDYELVLINTNVKHSLSDSAYNDRRAVCEKTAARLGKAALRDATFEELQSIKSQMVPEDYQKALYVIQEIDRTQKAAEALVKGDIKTLGKLIFASHDGLSKQYRVSCKELDFLVELAHQHDGVIGSRMMGGGFGGCTINLIEKRVKDEFIRMVGEMYLQQFGHPCSVYEVTVSKGTYRIS